MHRAVTTSGLLFLLGVAACASSGGVPEIPSVDEEGVFGLSGGAGPYSISGSLNFGENTFRLIWREGDCSGPLHITGNDRTQNLRIGCDGVSVNFRLLNGKLSGNGRALVSVREVGEGREVCVRWSKDPKSGAQTCELWKQDTQVRSRSYDGSVSAVAISGD